MDRLEKSLSRAPAVALLGPRQVGKTTLAQTAAAGMDAVYLDLEAPEDRAKLDDAGSFLRAQAGKLVILDEIQRAPDLFMVLRGVIDWNIQQGREAGQFLLLGSASMDLLRQSSESLAGRISYVEMSGLNAPEAGYAAPDIQKLWLRGGFPRSYLAADDGAAMHWLEDFIRTYLERDVPQAGFRIPADRLRRLWTMLAHVQGETVNHSALAANLEISVKTAGQYIDILAGLLLVRRLQPWHANVKKRLVKSPRCYIRDSGVQHRLLGIADHDALLSNPALGKSWEGFVIENLHSVLPAMTETYYYRTAAGAEIDLVIKTPSSDIWAVEIKFGRAPKLSTHYSRACDDIGAAERYVVYGGDEEFAVRDGVTMISLPLLMEKTASL
ncbi:MAG: ATP-binding protein [Rhodospirillales bacterium]